jgi:hypothetical protein
VLELVGVLTLGQPGLVCCNGQLVPQPLKLLAVGFHDVVGANSKGVDRIHEDDIKEVLESERALLAEHSGQVCLTSHLLAHQVERPLVCVVVVVVVDTGQKGFCLRLVVTAAFGTARDF